MKNLNLSSETKVSVIMNCHNGEEYLKEAIDSIYKQTFKAWEIIFFDNCSTDSTAYIASQYDERLKYFKSNEKLSLGNARNLALSKASSKYVAFLDCDDLYLSNKLKIQYELMERSNYIMCYGSAKIINQDGKKLKDSFTKNSSGYVFPELLNHYEINMQSVMIRNSILKRDNLNFPISYQYGPDYDLFMELASRGNVGVIKDVIVETRVHDLALSKTTRDRAPIELKETLLKIIDRDTSIQKKYPVEFRNAFQKIKYYESISLINENDIIAARANLKSIIFKRLEYLILYLLLFLKLPSKFYMKILKR